MTPTFFMEPKQESNIMALVKPFPPATSTHRLNDLFEETMLNLTEFLQPFLRALSFCISNTTYHYIIVRARAKYFLATAIGSFVSTLERYYQSLIFLPSFIPKIKPVVVFLLPHVVDMLQLALSIGLCCLVGGFCLVLGVSVGRAIQNAVKDISEVIRGRLIEDHFRLQKQGASSLPFPFPRLVQTWKMKMDIE